MTFRKKSRILLVGFLDVVDNQSLTYWTKPKARTAVLEALRK
jgi:hypothetical protein